MPSLRNIPKSLGGLGAEFPRRSKYNIPGPVYDERNPIPKPILKSDIPDRRSGARRNTLRLLPKGSVARRTRLV